MDGATPMLFPWSSPPSKNWARLQRLPLCIYGYVYFFSLVTEFKLIWYLWHRFINHGAGICQIWTHWQPLQKGPNRTLTLLCLHLATTFAQSLHRPTTLFLQADNCAPENKNHWVLAALCWFVHLGLFDTVVLSFLPVGHTHEDIDALFSIHGRHIHKHSKYATPAAFLEHYPSFFTAQPPSCHALSWVWDFKSFLNPFLANLAGHSKPHSFTINKSATGAVCIHPHHYSTTPPQQPIILTPTFPQHFPQPVLGLPPLKLEIVHDTMIACQDFSNPVEVKQYYTKLFSKYEGTTDASAEQALIRSVFSSFLPIPLSLPLLVSIPADDMNVTISGVVSAPAEPLFVSQIVAVQNEENSFWIAKICEITRRNIKVQWYEKDHQQKYELTQEKDLVPFNSIIFHNVTFTLCKQILPHILATINAAI